MTVTESEVTVDVDIEANLRCHHCEAKPTWLIISIPCGCSWMFCDLHAKNEWVRFQTAKAAHHSMDVATCSKCGDKKPSYLSDIKMRPL